MLRPFFPVGQKVTESEQTGCLRAKPRKALCGHWLSVFCPPDDGRTKPVPRKGQSESFEPADNKCLLRASDGKKKISTVVSTKEVIKFQMVRFGNLISFIINGGFNGDGEMA